MGRRVVASWSGPCSWSFGGSRWPCSWALDGGIKIVYHGQKIDPKFYMPDNSSNSSGPTEFPKINWVIEQAFPLWPFQKCSMTMFDRQVLWSTLVTLNSRWALLYMTFNITLWDFCQCLRPACWAYVFLPCLTRSIIYFFRVPRALLHLSPEFYGLYYAFLPSFTGSITPFFQVSRPLLCFSPDQGFHMSHLEWWKTFEMTC